MKINKNVCCYLMFFREFDVSFLKRAYTLVMFCYFIFNFFVGFSIDYQLNRNFNLKLKYKLF